MNSRALRITGIALGMIPVATSVTSRNAHAYPWYIESQAGASQFRSTDRLFDSGTTNASSMGVGFNLGIFYSPMEPASGFDFQIGLEQSYLSGSEGTANYGILAPMVMARMQFLWGYVSAGVAPLVWYRNQQAPGFDNFTHAVSTIAYVGDFGLLYPATPKFSLGGAVSLMFFSLNGAFAPSPSTQYSFVMRFYFGSRGASGEGGAPLEYNGWRYIGK